MFKDGRRARALPFVIIALPNTLSGPRLGIAIAKRLVPRATDRNYLKRIVRESFRHNLPNLGAVDVVVHYANPHTDVKRAPLFDLLRGAWTQLKHTYPRN